MRNLCLLATVAAVGGVDLVAQVNSRGVGYNGRLSDISSARAWGRRGAAYPGGEVGVSFQNVMCNPGTINIEWKAPMLPDHPKFGFLVAKEERGRLLQISDWSYCKHAFLSLNTSGTCGTQTCSGQPSGNVMYPGCSDVYSNGNNGDRNYLGPPEEIDPWTGIWNPVGSYFDRGDPDVGPPGNSNGTRSPINVGTDAVKNRVTIKESDLQGVTSGLYFAIHLIHEGEPVGNRGDNLMSRPFSLTWNGTSWSASTSGTATHGSILSRWTGSTLNLGQNGNDDGRFAVAVKVTGPAGGLYHYEFAIHNIDNSRGGASLRIPLCPTARVSGLGFRDIDANALNEWTATVAGGEIAFTAPAANPQNWNTIYNFWFDSDAAPVAGDVSIDEARVGAGALTVTVASQVPGFVPNPYLGAGCGSPTPQLFANGAASSPNPAFALQVQATPNTGAFAFFSTGTASLPLGGGCVQYLDAAGLGTYGFVLTNAGGSASLPLAIPPGLLPMDLHWQVATLAAGGPLFGQLNLTNGLTVRVASSGCP
jgi:hypothetical protein